MFKSKLGRVIGKVDGFINELRIGIDINATKVANLDMTIKDTASNAQDKIKKIEDKRDIDIEKQSAEQNAIYNELKAAEKLLNNLTKLKG